jgi:hypothetical protein
MMTIRPFHLRTLAALTAVVVGLSACDHYAAAQGSPGPSLTPAPSPRTATTRDSCAPPAAASPAVAALVRRSDGSCAPFDQAFVYRCDPGVPAVAVIDAGAGVRRFLGGAYAVPVDSLPPAAFPMGVTQFGALYQDPSDPSFLWVQADGATLRWLALPNRNKVSDPATAQMIGDSILDGGQTDVVTEMHAWTVAMDAEVGRGSYGAASVTESMPDPAADAVVVEIGVNDHDAAVFESNLARVVAAQGDARVLVWVTAHGPETDVPAINHAIVAGMGAIANGTVLDWDRLVPLDALSSDGIHPDVGQQGVLASLLVPFMSGWLSAVRGEGASACESAIRDAA